MDSSLKQAFFMAKVGSFFTEGQNRHMQVTCHGRFDIMVPTYIMLYLLANHGLPLSISLPHKQCYVNFLFTTIIHKLTCDILA